MRGQMMVLLFVLLLAVASGAMRAHAAKVPCETWTGWLRGNGALRLRLDICGADAVAGTMSMSGSSGSSVRRFLGNRGTAGMIAHETGILSHRYENGWWHCPVDRYDLRVVAPGVMRGMFVSRACSDRGTLELRKTR